MFMRFDSICDYDLVIWDFDGVIKESVEIKSRAYPSLFLESDDILKKRISAHHEENPGMSRFDKIPLYMEWSGLTPDEDTLAMYLAKFASLVEHAVVNSPWVPGIERVIESKSLAQVWALITATPEDEIERILTQLGIRWQFDYVHGAPLAKTVAVEQVIADSAVSPSNAIFFGDSHSDFSAAQSSGIEFCLRRTEFNRNHYEKFQGFKIEDFCNVAG